MIKRFQSHLLVLAFSLGLCTNISAQQVLFVVGDNNPAASDLSPELYVQDGADAYIYIQGGMTVITNATDAQTAEIINNGAIFINSGNFEHQNNSATASNLLIDNTTSAALTYPGGAPGTAYDTEHGTVHLIGASGQTISNIGTNTNSTITFHSLSIDGLSGTTNRSLSGVDVLVGGSSTGTLDGRLLLNDDRIDVNSHLLTVINSATNSVERNAGGSDVFVVAGMHPDFQYSDSTKGMIVTSSTGGFGRKLANTQNPYLFPVGNSNVSYRPALVKYGGATSEQIFIARNNGVNPFTGLANMSTVTGEIPVAVDPDNYWDVGSQNALAPADLSLNVRLFERLEPMGTISGACTITNILNELGVAQKRDASAATAPNRWADENTPFVVGSTGGSLGGTNPGQYLYWAETTNQIAKGANQMTQWATGTGTQMTLDQTALGVNGSSVLCAPFPIESLNLMATAIGNAFIRLDWATESELNNSHFEVQRSTDGMNFYDTYMKVNSAAPNGNSNTTLQYSKNDVNVQPQIMYYYRLKVYDLNGAVSYSNIASAILFNESSTVAAVYPNPTDGQINVQINCTFETQFAFRLYNLLGQELMTQFVEAKAGENIIHLDLSNLAYGTYELVVAEDGKNKKAFKIVKF